MTSQPAPLTRDQAMAEFRALVARHGLQWTARAVPEREPWDRPAEVNRVLTADDRREALGLPVRRPVQYRP